MRKVSITFYASTKFVGADREEAVIIEVPDDYDVEVDPDRIIEDQFQEWMWNTLELGWYEND